MPCWCQDNWRIHVARILHRFHHQGWLVSPQDLLRSIISDQGDPQKDERHHHPRHLQLGLEGSRQQAFARFHRQGHREVVPRSLPIARCLHSQGEFLKLPPVSVQFLPGFLSGESAEEAPFRLVKAFGTPRWWRQISWANCNSRCRRRRSRTTRRIRTTSHGRRLKFQLKIVIERSFDGLRACFVTSEVKENTEHKNRWFVAAGGKVEQPRWSFSVFLPRCE